MVEVETNLALVVGSGIRAVFDSPYPELLSLLLPAMAAADVPARLVLSVRPVKKWAERRLKTHGGIDVICKNKLQNKLQNCSGPGLWHGF